MCSERFTPIRHRGFTLIELMVAMVLGLMTTVIIAEVMLKSEGNRRTTTEGSDAQLNGALALYALQRDIQMAGYGIISTNSVLGCEVRGKYGSNAAFSFTLAPVLITASGNAAVSDTITVLRSGDSGYAIPIFMTAAHNNTDPAFFVQTTLGIAQNDIMLAMPLTPSATSWCTIFTVNGSVGNVVTPTTIPVVAGTGTWNPSTSNMPVSYPNGGMLTKITNMVYRKYAVTGNDLVATDLTNDTDTPSSNTAGTQVILMKAYYGKDKTGDGTVDAYETTTPATNAEWKQVKTIRIAVVARSAQRETTPVTTADPVWDVGNIDTAGSSACGTRKCVTLKISPSTGTDTEWQHYRYKVFDTVVPLRNMLWTS